MRRKHAFRQVRPVLHTDNSDELYAIAVYTIGRSNEFCCTNTCSLVILEITGGDR